jgi:tRNA/rRNA methyltransferase
MVCFAFSNGALGKNSAARYGMVMSDDSQIPATAHTMPCFVLVRPQMGENIGAAARAMWNFGLNHMRLVAPRDGWPNERAVALASGAAGVVLDPALVVETTPEAIGDCTHVFMTTARERGLTKPILSPEAAMAQARTIHAAGGKVAVIFGPERAGLENDDIARADAIITVPVNPDFPSLNLAQSVLLCAYEWRRQTTEVVEMRMEFARSDFATAIEVEKLADHYEEKLDEMGYFFPETKAAGMKLVLRNLWGRLPLTRADVQLFHGILRQMQRWRDRP